MLVQANDVQFNFPGSNVLTTQINHTFNANTYYTFAFTYDPTLAGVAGQQPWSFSIDGTDIAISVAADTVYTKLTKSEYAAFGGRFSNGLTTRFIDGFSFSTSAAPEPTAMLLVSIGISGAVFRRRARIE